MKMTTHSSSLGRVRLMLLFSGLAAAGALLNHFFVPGYIENMVLQVRRRQQLSVCVCVFISQLSYCKNKLLAQKPVCSLQL